MGKRISYFIRTLPAVSFLLIFSAFPAVADTEGGPLDYTSITPDGKHIFVNAGPRGLVEFEYPTSGMYLNDGSKVPLWTVDWRARVSLPNGGDYLIRHGKWAYYSGRYDEEGITFVAKGELLRTYTAKDIVDFPWLLPHSVSHYGWGLGWRLSDGNDGMRVSRNGEAYKDASVTFDSATETVEIRTQLGDHLIFDLKTGELVRSSRPALLIALALSAFLLLVYVAWRLVTSPNFPHHSRIGLSNIVAGLLFAAAVLIVPLAAIQVFRVPDEFASDLHPLLYAWSAFATFPYYIAAFFGYKPTMLTSNFPLWVYGFWVALAMAFAIFDRGAVALLRGRRVVPERVSDN